jgi:hypothetical protein
MRVLVSTLTLSALARRVSRLARWNLVPAVLAGLLLVQPPSASAALSFGRGTPTSVGSVRFSSSPDSVLITGALTGPGTITSGLSIPAKRIQYDVINSDQGPMFKWTLFYSSAVGPQIIGAATPLGYVDLVGTLFPEGGYAYTTLFNAGFGIYNYNTGAPWTIDYEPDHITFSSAAAPPSGLPANDGAGFLNPTPYLPSFSIEFSPSLESALLPATAVVGTATLNGQVYGPTPGNPCLSILCTNLTIETCSNCVPVPFSATAIDNCCSNPPVVEYYPPSGACLPLNSTTPVTVLASDDCGNFATNTFIVTVVPGPNCVPTNCISIYATNLTAYTCSDCTPVPFNVFAIDPCCPVAAPTVVFNPPVTTCFPVNSTTPVHVTAFDQCGHTNTATFTVTVLPGPNCGNTNCISLHATNIVAYTCADCATVPYNVFATDNCCPGVPNPSVSFNPPETTCFPVNSTTTVTATAVDQCGNTATSFFTVTVLRDPRCDTNCISIDATNITAFTCTNCASVPFNVFATDTCCAAPPALSFNPPETTCFPVNSTTPVVVTATDQCGHTATKTFTVTVLRGLNCGPTNCIALYATNIVVYTCTNCVTVPYYVTAFDPCCNNNLSLVYNPPVNTCFPRNTTTPVQVLASDSCGHTAIGFFTVTVLPGAGCGGGAPGISMTGTSPLGGAGTNYYALWWSGSNAQVEATSDLLRWQPVPGATNSPYVVPATSSMSLFRLHYH